MLLDDVEIRVLACLVEKAATTPDAYPLSSRALTVACNQTTNRDPVVDHPERLIDATMLELRQKGLARTVQGAGQRVPKHRHVLDEAWGLDGPEIAVLAILALRGPQTVNEITTRTQRYVDGPGSTGEVEAAIDRLAGRDEPLVVRLDRRAGEREPRVAHLLAGPPAERAGAVDASATAVIPTAAPEPPAPDLEDRVDDLAARLEHLERTVDELRAALGDL